MRAVSGWIRGRVREKVGIDARDVHFGAVTFIQRFGDALDLNPYFHSLVLDGAYVVRHGRFEGFVQIGAPSDEDVAGIAVQVAKRLVRMLRRRGKVERDTVAAVQDNGSMLLPWLAASVQRLGVMGEAAGRTLRRPGRRRDVDVNVVRVAKRRCADVDGFSLHADVCVPARDRARLVSATNDDAEVVLERDVLGRIVKETTARGDAPAVVIERKFDHEGLRIGLSSSMGADVSLVRDAMGDVLRMKQAGAAGAWETSFTRDVLGDEIERVLPGGVRSTWWRDALGRPTQHVVGTGDRVHRQRQYVWGADDRLLSIADSGVAAEHEHDGRGMLVRRHVGETTIDGRYPDDLGRIFETASQTDRAYGAGGELQWRRDASGTTSYGHDAQGRLATRVDPGGGTWRYWWNDGGRLVQVDRPQGDAVRFTYDALGRRLTKCGAGVRTCFAWDGQQVLHEWSEAAEAVSPRALPGEDARERALIAIKAELVRMLPQAQARARWEAELERNAKRHPGVVARLRAAEGGAPAAEGVAAEGVAAEKQDVAGEVITWLFAPGGHAPMARVTAAGGCSIVADQVGAPLVVLDDRGEVKAQLVVDSRGRAVVDGDAALCPWRFAGQYRDDETGLHYNRFRYYDADAGQYISRDPLGLRAGLRVYGYVGDPGVASDPLGLAPVAGEGCGGSGDGADPARRRVRLRKATREEVQTRQPRNADEELVDPNTGEPLLSGEIDVGHKPGQEWRKRQQLHRDRGSTRDEVIEAENDPDLYQLEDRSENRSHRHEQ